MIPSFFAGIIKILGFTGALGLILIVPVFFHTLLRRIFMFGIIIAIGGFAYAIFSA